jgi:hypothetical protein
MPYRPNFPIPPDIDPPRKCLCIEIPWTPEHKQVFAGLLWELTEWFNWQRDSARSGKQLAAVYRSVFNSIDWSDMSCCCNQTTPVLTRVDPETGYVTQISYDGGTTWITNPNSPSLTAPEMPPPVTSGVSGTKCDAASNGLQHIKDLVSKQSEQMTGEISITEAAIAIGIFIIGLILAAFTEGAALPAIVPVLVGVLSTIFALGKVAFDSYWTSDVYDKILCALYCNIDDSGQFSDAQAAAAINKINSDLPASPAKDWLIQILHVMGTRGLNNICAYGSSSDADCSGCDCSTCVDDWSWPVDAFGAAPGDFVKDSDAGTITVSAKNLAGHYYWGLSSETCCTCTVEILEGTGSIEFRGVIPCPLPEGGYSWFVESSPPWVIEPIGITDTPALAVFIRSNATFKAKVTFT